MQLNPELHKNMIRMCKQFNVNIQKPNGEYEDLSTLQKHLKRQVGYK